MTGKYTDLDTDHQRELLVNLLVNAALIELFEEDSPGDVPIVWRASYDRIAAMSVTEVQRIVEDLESQHRPFGGYGGAVRVKL